MVKSACFTVLSSNQVVRQKLFNSSRN